MENKIQQIIQLNDKYKYLILQQVVYKNENYFMTVRVTPDEQDLTDEFELLHETIENGQTCVERIQDPTIAKIILNYIKGPETEES